MSALAEREITASMARGLLNYDHTTGILTWAVSRGRKPAGSIAGYEDNGYIRLGLFGLDRMAHRVVWLIVTGEWPKDELDHRDLCRSNNRWLNLREATSLENKGNTAPQANNSSGFKGVTFVVSRHRWRATIGWMILSETGEKIPGQKWLGYFDTPEGAAAAYAAAAIEKYGDFARTKQGIAL